MTQLSSHIVFRANHYLSDMERICERILRAWSAYQANNDEFILDSVALNLQNYYGAIENALKLFAEKIDNKLPTGADWHSELLKQLTVPVPDLRPAVISLETKGMLDNYRGFRHVVRNMYAFNMDPRKIKPLVDTLSQVDNALRTEIVAFLKLLENT
jgi:hypothetical protein